MREALVTGATGFLGSALLGVLRVHPEIAVTRVAASLGQDLLDANWADSIRADPQVVFHLAGRTFVPDSWKAPATYFENVRMTANVLEFCRTRAARLVLVSAYVYGKPQYLPIDEAHPVSPGNPYAHGKWMSEELCRFYSKHFGVRVAIARLFNIYGPGQDERFLIPSIVRQALADGVVVIEDAKPRRDYLYVDDAARALAEFMNDSGSAYELYNIGSGESWSVTEVIEKIAQASRTQLTVSDRENRRQNEIADCVADAAAFRNHYHWEPTTSFEEGIDQVVKSCMVTTN